MYRTKKVNAVMHDILTMNYITFRKSCYHKSSSEGCAPQRACPLAGEPTPETHTALLHFKMTFTFRAFSESLLSKVTYDEYAVYFCFYTNNH